MPDDLDSLLDISINALARRDLLNEALAFAALSMIATVLSRGLVEGSCYRRAVIFHFIDDFCSFKMVVRC